VGDAGRTPDPSAGDNFMATDSTFMNTALPHQRKAKTGRIILFILALVAVMIAARPSTAETLCMRFFKTCHNAVILSETKDSITIKLRDGQALKVPRSKIRVILKPGMKAYVYKRDRTDFTAYFRGSDESGFTFGGSADGTGEFTVKKGDIYFISDQLPGEAENHEKTNPPPGYELDAWSLLLAAGVFQGIFLVFMLLRKKTGNRRANRILALFILAGSIAISGGFAYPYLYRFPLVNQFFLSFENASPFLIGPLLFFYVLSLARPGFRPSIKHGLHLLIAVFAFFYLLFDAVIMNGEQLRIISSQSCHFFPSITHMVLSTVFGIHPIIYVVLSIRFLAAHRRRIQDIFSSTEKVTLSWLSYLLRFMLCASALWLVPLSMSRAIMFLDLDHHFILLGDILLISLNATAALLALLFFAIGYRGLAQPEIFAGIPDDLVEGPAETDQKISLSTEKAREIMDRVTKVMDEQRPYLDPGLTLPMLADMAGVSRNLLSQAINERTGQNFYDFVNFYRVETVKEYLKDPAKREMNVLHIAFDAGFNAKATFNSVFKKSTGLTPSAYRKNFEAAEGAASLTQTTLQ